MCKEFSRTRFITVPITETLNGGIPIGQGKCGAVRLRLNIFPRNQAIAVGIDQGYFFVYYGDSQSQENELIAYLADTTTGDPLAIGGWTPKIYCENLEEIFIRYGGQTQIPNERWPTTAHVQVMILDPVGNSKAGGCGKA